jgi:phosphate transport system substrate-binding protein
MVDLVSAATAAGGKSVYSYTPTGSGDGKAKVASGGVLFAGSDSALSASEQQKMPKAWVVPTLAGAVVIGVNVPGFAAGQLRIPREVLADIFLGKLSRWSELAPWNPGLERVTANISLVVRSDSSGMSEAFTAALSRFSPEFKAKVGTSSLPRWPIFKYREKGTEEVAIRIRVELYSIGYVSQDAADAYNVRYANISNAAGTFVRPSTLSVQAAMDAFEGGLNSELQAESITDFFQSISDAPATAADAYPIATMTYMAFDPGRLGCAQLFDVVFMLHFLKTSRRALETARDFGFCPLSTALRLRMLHALRRLECGGENMLQRVTLFNSRTCQPGTPSMYACTPSSQQGLDVGAGAAIDNTEELDPKCSPCKPGSYSTSPGSSCGPCPPGMDGVHLALHMHTCSFGRSRYGMLL